MSVLAPRPISPQPARRRPQGQKEQRAFHGQRVARGRGSRTMCARRRRSSAWSSVYRARDAARSPPRAPGRGRPSPTAHARRRAGRSPRTRSSSADSAPASAHRSRPRPRLEHRRFGIDRERVPAEERDDGPLQRPVHGVDGEEHVPLAKPCAPPTARSPRSRSRARGAPRRPGEAPAARRAPSSSASLVATTRSVGVFTLSRSASSTSSVTGLTPRSESSPRSTRASSSGRSAFE